MKKKKFLSEFLALILCMVVFVGCSREPQPEDVVNKLETAFNTLDVDMMLECYEPSVQKMYSAMMEVGGQFMGGIDLATIISGLGGFTDVFGDELGVEIPTVTFTVNSKQMISDSKAVLNVTLKYDYGGSVSDVDGEEVTEDMYFVKIDGQWYISAKKF